MAFPSSPTNGQIANRFGRKFQFNSTSGTWLPVQAVAASTLAETSINTLSDIDLQTTAPQDGETLVWNAAQSKFVPGAASGSGTTVYATIAELPLSGNDAGSQAYVSENNRLYIWNGSGWYNIALINTAPTITSGPNASYELAADGTPIVLTLTAQDPEGVPITWSYAVTTGSLGNTATVSQADNVFTITPSTSDTDAGSFSITFTASDGVNLATAASSFTLTFGPADTYYNLNSILIKTGSTTGLTNATIIDESSNAFTVTRTGDVYQGSFSPYSPAGWSGYFDGTGDYIATTSSSSNFELTGDFTIEFWYYRNTTDATERGLVSLQPASGLAGIRLIDAAGGKLSVTLISGNGTYHLDLVSATSNTLTPFAWNHIAVTRSGSDIKSFVNGTLDQSGTSSAWTGTDIIPIIGSGRNYASGALLTSVIGNIADVRIVKGTALYTSNFTPPTSKLTAISGTSLLTLQDSWFKDNSTNNIAITTAGDAKPVPNSPYKPSEQYDPAVHGGSMYFDGTDDRLTLSSSAAQFGSGDFTVEAWIYPITISSGKALIDFRSTTAATWGQIYLNADNTLHFWLPTPDVGTTNTVTLNSWNHIVVTRVSNVLKMFINGVEGYSGSQTFTANASNITIGHGINGSPSTAGFIGYISEVRFITGTAVYTSNFTPPTQSLTAISGTSLLVRGTNAGVYDETGKTNISLIGNATTSTTVAKYNDTSIYFDGSGDSLILPAEVMNFGTGDFTIETWIRLSVFDRGLFRKSTSTDASATPGVSVYVQGNTLYVGVSPGDASSTYITASHPFILNTWAHFVIVRDSGTVKIFVNGTLLTSASNSVNVDNTTTVRIGEWRNASEYFNGYLEDFRITKGYARYTANFTPPTAALGFSNAE